MPAMPPVHFTNVDFTLTTADGEVNVSCAVTKAEFSPDVSIETLRTLCGVVQDAAEPTWTLEVDYSQRWGADDLASVLNAHAGKTADAKLTWQGVSTASATVLLTPGPWGGEAGAVATGSVSLPVVGQPVFTAAALAK